MGLIKKIFAVKGELATIIGTIAVVSAVYFNVKKPIFGDPFERPKSAVVIEDSEIRIERSNGWGSLGKMEVKLETADDGRTIYLGNYTQDYDRQDWAGTEEEKIPPPYRHNRINPMYSELFVLHPENTEIKTEQRAFLVPQYEWDTELKLYEEHEEAQMIIGEGEKLLDFVKDKIENVPFSKEVIDKLAERSYISWRKRMAELRSLAREDYVITKIPQYLPQKILGYVETAREYKIEISGGNFPEYTVYI